MKKFKDLKTGEFIYAVGQHGGLYKIEVATCNDLKGKFSQQFPSSTFVTDNKLYLRTDWVGLTPVEFDDDTWNSDSGEIELDRFFTDDKWCRHVPVTTDRKIALETADKIIAERIDYFETIRMANKTQNMEFGGDFKWRWRDEEDK